MKYPRPSRSSGPHPQGSQRVHRRPTGATPVKLLLILLIVFGALVGCAQQEVKAIPLGPDGVPDPVLVQGQDIWVQRCSVCHGAQGNGGTGPKLADGRVDEKYPDVAVQVSVVTNGVGGRMPAFRDSLTADEIKAVVRYTREVL